MWSGEYLKECATYVCVTDVNAVAARRQTPAERVHNFWGASINVLSLYSTTCLYLPFPLFVFAKLPTHLVEYVPTHREDGIYHHRAASSSAS